MRNVDVEKFLADYDVVVKEKEDKVNAKDAALLAEKEKAEKVCVENGYSDAVKEMLVAEVVAEKEKEFDLTEIDEKIASFEKYIVETEDVCSDDEELKEAEPEEVSIEENSVIKFDAFGNPIVG